jgi:hypothetical protein
VDWAETYTAFKLRIKRHFDAGDRWVADFDLAAFYDTVSNRALINVMRPRGGHAKTCDTVASWLNAWSADNRGYLLDHGIPQGPIASDFLAEVLLIQLDEEMQQSGIGYVRYADDIRLFARTEHEVRTAAVKLEIACRRLGLIPQSSKFSIRRARTLRSVFGSLPSIAESSRPTKSTPPIKQQRAEKLLREALSGRPLRIVDKSRVRFVLYRAEASPKLLNWTLDLIPQHPEQVDAFVAYLSNYGKSRRIVDKVTEILERPSPYEYVRGELWHVLARIGERST